MYSCAETTVNALFWMIVWTGCYGVYFPQVGYWGYLTPGMKIGSPVLKLYATRSVDDFGTGRVRYILGPVSELKTNNSYSSHFNITDDGWITIRKELPFLKNGIKTTLVLEVRAVFAPRPYRSREANTLIILTTYYPAKPIGSQVKCHRQSEVIDVKNCFYDQRSLDFQIEEGINNITFGRLRQTLPTSCSTRSVVYNLTTKKKIANDINRFISIDNTTSELFLKTFLSHQSMEELVFWIRCTAEDRNASFIERKVTLKVVPVSNPNHKHRAYRTTLRTHFPQDKVSKRKRSSPVVEKVFRNASKFTTVHVMSQDYSRHPLYSVEENDIFGITENTGIMYVKDDRALRELKKDHVTLQVNVSERDSKTLKFIQQVIITLTDGPSLSESCDGMCSKYRTETECTSNCGVGAPTGRCQWKRGKYKEMSENYTTCRPNEVTCPDKKCDELEMKHPYICLQDCTTQITYSGLLRNGMGILKAIGICSCDAKMMCHCYKSSIEMEGKYEKSTGIVIKSTSRPVDAVSNAIIQKNDSDLCDRVCESAMATVFGCLAMICVISFVIWWVVKRRRLRSDTLKHVGSVVSVSAAPSDYVSDQERQLQQQQNLTYCASKGPRNETFALSSDHIDKKWEFPRKHLIIEESLGEGEFGMVMRARAFNIEGKSGYTTVAVKMLKECASIAEFRDLWSEFNLLKEVNHPNVIRLLGVCAHRGPFYVIVEYCQYGSLKNFLRTHRQTMCVRTQRTSDENTSEHGQLTSRDLLSFAWQVCKGMRYLCQMKLVHRDLAARNVLVATGNVIKISDFGLTRDIYEADAYMKKSKGRIPVKWMAPESLYAQVYTSKSDVWSFGVLLWEIITLGANPYPGIPPERLFSLLKTGYRMDRPENCSDEIYAIMQKCWKTEPAQRPSFGDLADIFDRLLQERTGYLQMDGFLHKATKPVHCTVCPQNKAGDSSLDKDSEDAYGSISVFSTDVNAYLTPVVHNYANKKAVEKFMKRDLENNCPEMYERNSLKMSLLNNTVTK